MPKLYTPPRDSLAAYVVGYFQNNPTEELTLDDIAEKFSVKSRSNIHTELSDAWRADLIRRDTSKDGEVVYTAGNLEFTAARIANPAHTTSTKPAKRKPRATNTTPIGTCGFPDPLLVPVDDDVPCLSARSPTPICWLPLLKRLTNPGHSAALPLYCKATLAKSITQAHKQGSARYTTKKDPKAGVVRVWRLA